MKACRAAPSLSTQLAEVQTACVRVASGASQWLWLCRFRRLGTSKYIQWVYLWYALGRSGIRVWAAGRLAAFEYTADGCRHHNSARTNFRLHCKWALEMHKQYWCLVNMIGTWCIISCLGMLLPEDIQRKVISALQTLEICNFRSGKSDFCSHINRLTWMHRCRSKVAATATLRNCTLNSDQVHNVGPYSNVAKAQKLSTPE